MIREANRRRLTLKRQKLTTARTVDRLGKCGVGRRGRLVLQPRRVIQIFVTSVVLVTLALSGVAAAAAPDRDSPHRASSASPAPDPAPQSARSSTHTSTTTVTVTPPTSRVPATPIRSTPRISSRSVAGAVSSVVHQRPATRRTVPAHKHHPPAARPSHHAGPVSLDLELPRVTLPALLDARGEPQPNGVLLLLSSLALGMLVVASLTLLRRVKRMNGGW